jgi:uncharacterized protein
MIAALLGVVMTLLFSINALAYTSPAAPTDGFLLDQAHVLSDGDAASIRSRLAHINTDTKNQIAVFIASDLGGADIDDVGHQVFNTWGVGKKGLDNGVLLVWAPGERKIRIETGKGVGGELTDLQSNDIIQKMKPAARAGQFAVGVNIAIDSISSTLDNRSNTPAPSRRHSAVTPDSSSGCDASGGGAELPIIVGVVILLVILFLIFRRRGGGASSSWGSFGGGDWGSSSSGSSGSSSSDGGFGGGESGGGGSSDSY